MSVCSKNAKLGPSTEVASAQLTERAQLLLARCLVLLDDIDGAYYYEAIGTGLLLVVLLCTVKDAGLWIMGYDGTYTVTSL
jgi:hypothetical protein